jgi:agmatinase
MGYNELFVSQPNIFAGIQRSFERANYLILGVPFDATSTCRMGARFGPGAIRRASLNIETYSLRADVDLEELKMHDVGDLHISMDTSTTLQRLELVLKDLLKSHKKLIVMGGEHTITFGILKSLQYKMSETGIVSFDAHLDLRNDFLGLQLSHTTFMRRIKEDVKPAKIIEVGTRAVCREELEYAKKAGIEFISSHQIRNEGTEKIANQLRDELSICKYVYLSVDLDVLDPAYAPAVQCPEPEGLETHTLLDILYRICDDRVVGFDIVELAPYHENSISAIQAAKIIFELLCYLEKRFAE